jgi:hypothetical protein
VFGDLPGVVSATWVMVMGRVSVRD